MIAAVSAVPVDVLAKPRKSARVVSRIVAGEHILVPLASRGVDIDSIYNLNTAGSFLWERIDGSRTIGDIAHDLAREFHLTEEQARQDCLYFHAQLLEVAAIEIDSPGRSVE